VNELHPYQQEAIKFLLTHPRAGLLLPVGLGKTRAMLTAMLGLFEARLAKRALVICPIRAIHQVWKAELNKWFPGQVGFADLRTNPGAQPMAVECVSPSALEKVLGNRPPWDILVVDESTDFKNSRTQRFRLLRKYLREFKFRYLLTGSPAPNSLMDLWAQTFLLDVGDALGPFVSHYRANYFFPTGYGGHTWVLRNGSEQLIYDKVRHLYFRIDPKDAGIQLPELILNEITVELPPAARREYDRMEKEFFAIVEAETIVSPNAGAAGMRLRQIANGRLYVSRETSREVLKVHDEKAGALAELVAEQSGQPLLVLYEFEHDVMAIREALGYAVPNLSEVTSELQLTEMIKSWNRGEIPVLLGHPLSIGKALNLQGSCAAICFYGTTWSLLNYEQSIGRVWRQGNPAQTVVVHHITAQDTVDHRVLQVLAGKKKTQDELNKALVRRS
jgi:SNF2-related domain/Helicase conserved C-terminal domain